MAPGQAVTAPPLRGGFARWRVGKRSQTPYYVGGLRDGAPVDARQAGGIIGL